MFRPRAWLLGLLAAPALAAQDGGAPPARAAIDAPALFAANCAKCHGLDGSGTGPAVLDRPARNFKEGGFSFGNTPETIARTLAHGIPGSPMPAFEGALSDAQLRALADFVITLGPPVKEVSEAETLLHVTDRPLVVRGILPPLVEGGPVIPRGLLIGTTDGLTFEYAADDVRLLAVRLGDFVKRADWGDRGGSPLEPLGKVVWSHDSKGGPWSLAGVGGTSVQGLSAMEEPLGARLLSTTTSPNAAVTYVLTRVGESAPAFALIKEQPGIAKLGEHSGFVRRINIERVSSEADKEARTLALQLGDWTEVLSPEDIGDRRGTGPVSEEWWMRTVAPDVGELLHVIRPLGFRISLEVRPTPGGLTGLIYLGRLRESHTDFGSGSDEIGDFELETFVVSPWTPASIAELRKELAP